MELRFSVNHYSFCYLLQGAAILTERKHWKKVLHFDTNTDIHPFPNLHLKEKKSDFMLFFKIKKLEGVDFPRIIAIALFV